MTVELTPAGTRGPRVPRPPAPLIGLVDALGAAAYRRFGERMRIAGLPLLMLTTYGAKTGARRRSLLGWLPEGNDAWLIYATASGAARHPGWYFNLARNADRVWIDVGKRHIRVRPESLKGGERDAAYRRVVDKSPRYGTFEQVTDRQIPVVRLTAVT